MSWLIGFAGQAPTDDVAKVHDTSIHGVSCSNVYAQAGGLDAICHGGVLHQGGKFLVTGLAAVNGRVLSTDDWAKQLNPPSPTLHHLDGHFVALRMRDDVTELFTDPLGIRTLHLVRWKSGTLFSTRLDWIVRLTGSLDIDYEVFGAHWLLANQLTTISQVQGVDRLGPGGHARLSGQLYQIQEQPWACDIGESDPKGLQYKETLLQALTWQGPVKWSLGLSGGLDSRVLLALHPPDSTHVWGPSNHPDVRIATRIASKEHLSQHYYKASMLSIDQCLKDLRVRVALTQVSSPASAAASLIYYSRLHSMGFGVVDGGFGEVARRQFMNRVLTKRSFLARPEDIMPLLSFKVADAFIPDIHAAMHRGAVRQIEFQWDALPQAIDPANAADLISTRSRLPNFFGFEQNFLDSQAVCYMPYAQASVLRALFQVPVTVRRGGRLFRQLIKQHRKSLRLYPLVKGSVTYPYGLTTHAAQAITVVKKSLNMVYHDRRTHQFLALLKPYVLDTIYSRVLRECEVYDYARLRTMIEDYYHGEQRHATALNWWLAFEMWRQMLQGAPDQVCK